MTDIVCPNCNSRNVLRSLEWWADSPYKLECLDCGYVWTPIMFDHSQFEEAMIRRLIEHIDKMADAAKQG